MIEGPRPNKVSTKIINIIVKVFFSLILLKNNCVLGLLYYLDLHLKTIFSFRKFIVLNFFAKFINCFFYNFGSISIFFNKFWIKTTHTNYIISYQIWPLQYFDDPIPIVGIFVVSVIFFAALGLYILKQ